MLASADNARRHIPLVAPASASVGGSFSAGSIAAPTSCGDTVADKQHTKASVDTGVEMVGAKVGAERHRSAASGDKLQVDPPYFDHGRCSDAVQIAHCVAHRQQRAPRAAGGHHPVKRLAGAAFAATATVGVLRIWGPDNSKVSRSIDI